MTNIEKIKEIVKRNSGLITRKEAKENNIPTWFLSLLTKKGKLSRIEKGIYVDVNNGWYDEYYFFQYRYRKYIFSYQSALYFHGLTDRVPYQIEVTAMRGYNPTKDKSKFIVHYVMPKYYSIGICEVETTTGFKVRCYDMERTICDIVKHREVIDTEIFVKAIKAYVKKKNADFVTLMKYAKLLGVYKEVSNLIEVISNE